MLGSVRGAAREGGPYRDQAHEARPLEVSAPASLLSTATTVAEWTKPEVHIEKRNKNFLQLVLENATLGANVMKLWSK